jgi:Flp pilus assembly pilin Flp
MKKLWMDESGAILSVELILIMVLVVIGLVVGLKALRDTVDGKLVELSAAVAAIDCGYGWGGITYISGGEGTSLFVTADGAWVAGSMYSSQMAIEEAFGLGAGAFDPAVVLESETVACDTQPAIISQ